MSPPNHYPLRKYLREEELPNKFCPGCGNGTVLNAFAAAVDDLGLDTKKMVNVSGIGCSSWIPSPYFKADTIHTTHGRPIAFATGIKIMRPDLLVTVTAGDGDIAGIGGNHLIHAARRNIDFTVIMVNNMIYGMTGGQVAPTTPLEVATTTTPYGNPEPPFKMSEMVAAAGATYVAKWTTYHVNQVVSAIKKGIENKGFSFIEVVSQCPQSYGRRIGLTTGPEFLKMFKEKSITIEKAKDLNPEELQDRYVIGTLCDRERAEFTEELHKIRDKRMAALK